MISFNYETDFKLDNETSYETWIGTICTSEKFLVGDLNFIFCGDDYLLNINQTYLQHDTFTDIITFDYSIDKHLSGDIFISTERVLDNSTKFSVSFAKELLRVIAHGILHLAGFKDKEETDILIMRAKENEKIKMFHVEQ